MTIRIIAVSDMLPRLGVKIGQLYKVDHKSYCSEKKNPGKRDMYLIQSPSGLPITIYGQECVDGWAEGITTT